MRNRIDIPGFRLQPSRPTPLGPETNMWYWNPNRPGVKSAPDWFMEKLHDVGEELSCTWNPITERWQVFSRAPRLQHPICSGWKLLFVHETASKEYLPLDERLFARLYAASVMEHGSARRYFERITAEIERDRAKREADRLDETIQMGMEVFNHSQIRNIGNGSKFSTYHA